MMEAKFTVSSIEYFLWFESSMVNLGRSMSESASSESVASRPLSGSPGSDPVLQVRLATTRFRNRSASAVLVKEAHGRLGRMKWSLSEWRRCFSVVGGWGTRNCSFRSSFLRRSWVCWFSRSLVCRLLRMLWVRSLRWSGGG